MNNRTKKKIEKKYSEFFKKLHDEVWEFRTKYSKTYYLLFAFWDKTKIFSREKKRNGEKMKTYRLEELTDKYIDKKGTKKGMNSRTNLD